MRTFARTRRVAVGDVDRHPPPGGRPSASHGAGLLARRIDARDARAERGEVGVEQRIVRAAVDQRVDAGRKSVRRPLATAARAVARSRSRPPRPAGRAPARRSRRPRSRAPPRRSRAHRRGCARWPRSRRPRPDGTASPRRRARRSTIRSCDRRRKPSAASRGGSRPRTTCCSPSTTSSTPCASSHAQVVAAAAVSSSSVRVAVRHVRLIGEVDDVVRDPAARSAAKHGKPAESRVVDADHHRSTCEACAGTALRHTRLHAVGDPLRHRLATRPANAAAPRRAGSR